MRRSLSSKVPAQLIDGDLELGVISYDPEDERLISEVIYTDHLAFVVSPLHRFAKLNNVSITQLGMETFIAHNVLSPYREVVLREFQRHKVPLNMDVEMPTVETIRKLVQRQTGVNHALPRQLLLHRTNMPMIKNAALTCSKRERGQALIESALVMLLFLSFLIGTLDFGQFLFFHQSLEERARAAARYGAVNPTDSTGTKNIAVYNAAAPADGASPVLAGLTTDMVGVVSSDTGTPEARVTITITGYPFTFLSPYIGGSHTVKPVVATMASEAP